jgi:hypothetical protein
MKTKWTLHISISTPPFLPHPFRKATERKNKNKIGITKAPASVPRDFFQLHTGIELDHNREKQNQQFHVFPFQGQPIQPHQFFPLSKMYSRELHITGAGQDNNHMMLLGDSHGCENK